MNGAEILIKTAVASGIGVCLANPGTTEVTILNALDTEPKVRTILGLFEGVCSGAADGYGRLQGRPAMNLLHQGPGFANSIGNMHNGQRAGTPILNIIGDHFTWHRELNTQLHLNIEAMAATLGWYRRTKSVETLSGDISDAIAAAQRGQIASLIVPQDHQTGQWTGDIVSVPRFAPERVNQEAVDRAAKILRTHSPSLLMLGGMALKQKGLLAAARISAATGCALFTETFPLCWDRGAGLPLVERTLYRPGEQAMLAKYRCVVLAGLGEPLTYFGREGFESRILQEGQEKGLLVAPGQDIVDALERLAEALDAPDTSCIPAGLMTELDRPGLPEGRLTVEKASRTLAAIQPEGAIIVEEGITACSAYYPVSKNVAPHTVLTVAGGNIGWGIPCAIGAALACPDRPVINFEGDGSAMYTIQALWTQAREGLNITTLIFSNRLYNAVRLQFFRDGASSGPVAESVTELKNPTIDWVKLSQGLGVPAEAVTTSEELARALRIALTEPGPYLIEIVLD
jgi:acetolactate synthase-1/2/3 large subunit